MPRLIPLLLLLSACAAPAPPPDTAFRNTATPLYSNAVFEPARLAGPWAQVAEFAAPGAPACRPDGLRFGAVGATLPIEARLCLNGAQANYAGQAALVVPGRFVLPGADPALAQPWWVIWVDTDYRTLVIGTPSGDFGFILNRDGALPPDRLAAAREILDWNGYDLARLRLLR